jgi:RimK-like ATP-grasp domain
MKSIYIAGGGPKNTAVKVLLFHLEKLGHRVTRDPKDPDGWDVTLRWGKSYRFEKPALNAGVNQYDKMTAMLKWQEKNVKCPVVFTTADFEREGYGPKYEFPFPWYARKRHHWKGKDIIKCANLAEAQDATWNGSSEFFSVFVPSKTEYRVWQFEDRTLAVYEKVQKEGVEWDGIARNRRFGFAFQKRDDLRADEVLSKLCKRALKHIGMDFGAIDLLHGTDDAYYVLEINSMPNIDTVKRSSGIRLAAAISKWAEAQ